MSAVTLTEAERRLRDDRFVEAVRKAFHQMTIRSSAEAAAWYTLRDWLAEQDEARRVLATVEALTCDT